MREDLSCGAFSGEPPVAPPGEDIISLTATAAFYSISLYHLENPPALQLASSPERLSKSEKSQQSSVGLTRF